MTRTDENSEVNRSEATREKKCRELAVMDWGKVPAAKIRESLDCSFQTITSYRETSEYKETLEELRREWMDAARRLPNTSELRTKISMGMTLSLDRLIEILVPDGKAQYKDKISAARLMAQLDGRFLRAEDGDEDTAGKNVLSVADELLVALSKQARPN